MNEGMLWYVDGQKNELAKTIENAVDFFEQKYGKSPLACYVHPDALSEEVISKDDVKVVANDKVIKNHIWLEFPQS